MKMTPHDIVSSQIAQFVRSYLPDDAFASCIAHGARHFATAIKLKQIGTESGFADWLVIYRGRAYAAEIKTGTGTMRKAQRDTRDRLARSGAPTEVIHDLDDFIAALSGWNIPLLDEPRKDPMDQDIPL